MINIKVKIEGCSPLLMNRFVTEEDDQKGGRKKNISKDEEVSRALYKDDNGQLFIPWTWIAGSVKNASSGRRTARNKKITLKSIIAGAFRLVDEKLYFNDQISEKDVNVYSVPVVIPSTRGRIIKHRPKIDKWSLEFTAVIDDDLLTVPEIKDVIEEAGRRIGIGDFRISKGGPFGMFKVTNFETF